MRLIGLAVVLDVGLKLAALVAEAQLPGKVYRIRWLSPASASTGASNFDALRNGLGELGYVEGKSWRATFYTTGRLLLIRELAATV